MFSVQYFILCLLSHIVRTAKLSLLQWAIYLRLVWGDRRLGELEEIIQIYIDLKDMTCEDARQMELAQNHIK